MLKDSASQIFLQTVQELVEGRELCCVTIDDVVKFCLDVESLCMCFFKNPTLDDLVKAVNDKKFQTEIVESLCTCYSGCHSSKICEFLKERLTYILRSLAREHLSKVAEDKRERYHKLRKEIEQIEQELLKTKDIEDDVRKSLKATED